MVPNWTVEVEALKLVGEPATATWAVKPGTGDRSGVMVRPCGDKDGPMATSSAGALGGVVVELAAVEAMLTGSRSVSSVPPLS
jgi:hypothetical protein